MFDFQEIPSSDGAGASGTMEPNVSSPLHNSREGGEAILEAQPHMPTPPRNIPQADHGSSPVAIAPAETELPGHHNLDHQRACAGQTQLAGHCSLDAHHEDASQPSTDCGQLACDTHQPAAAVGNQIIGRGHTTAETLQPIAPTDDPIPSQGQWCNADHYTAALVGEITAVYRRYEDLRRARQRILLQAIATCRTVCGGDKKEGMKLYKSPTPEVTVWLAPYEAAMMALTGPIHEHEKLLTKLGKKLPVAGWADTVPGLSHRFLAAIVGECGIGPGEFRSVSALWKRMGMAVIGGERQRRVSGDAALEHGYVARRRSLMWNIGDQVAVRQGIRNPKDEDGNSTGAVAINEWGALYLERKAYEIARECTPIHAHNRAKRYVEKRLLRELWKAWRRQFTTAEA